MSSMNKSSSKFAMASAVVFSLAALFAGAAASSKEKVLYDFRGRADGEYPSGSLIADGSGNLYGTTGAGGAGTGCDNGSSGCGTVFALSPEGQEKKLYAFAGGSDAAFPNPGLVVDKVGNLYGSSELGGGTSCFGGVGCGTVFKLAADGTENVLYAFQGGTDGWEPWGSGLAMDANGNLYGETLYGGDFDGSVCDASGCGTVFEVQSDGTKTNLHSFLAGSDGYGPSGALVFDDEGNLYGTTVSGGGTGCGGTGCGTVFEIAENGTESILNAFQGGADGAGPVGGVTLDSFGNLYGVTEVGGNCTLDSNECGTVFKLAPDGTKTLLYNFQGGHDGEMPWSPLILDAKGNLYGTTYLGGMQHGCKKYNGCGTVFEVSAKGKETILFAFDRAAGYHPSFGSLLLGTKGELYGAAPYGGEHKDGVVFELKK